MFLSRNKKNNVYPCKPQFCYIKVGFKGVKIKYACFRDESLFSGKIKKKMSSICLLNFYRVMKITFGYDIMSVNL